jgi:hypothetical protein
MTPDPSKLSDAITAIAEARSPHGQSQHGGAQ